MTLDLPCKRLMTSFISSIISYGMHILSTINKNNSTKYNNNFQITNPLNTHKQADRQTAVIHHMMHSTYEYK